MNSHCLWVITVGDSGTSPEGPSFSLAEAGILSSRGGILPTRGERSLYTKGLSFPHEGFDFPSPGKLLPRLKISFELLCFIILLENQQGIWYNERTSGKEYLPCLTQS